MNNRFLSEGINTSGNGSEDGMAEVSGEMLHEIWARRAAQLAEAPTDEDVGEQLDLVIVQLGAELYGLEAAYVFRIRPAEQITRVPRVPNWIAGVSNDRGNILSVFDLRRFLGLDEVEDANASPYLVVVQAAEMELALLADAVLNVISQPLGTLEAAPETMHGIPQEYIKGVVHQDFEWRVSESFESPDSSNGREIEVLTVLDLPALLSDEALVVREEMA
jgi:purine-binding chemotaxis protein CheW